jgi:hypothetical protein
VATPAWKGASVNSPGLASQVNQFLGTHAATFIYTGATLGGQTTAGAGAVNTNGLYVAQTFTPGSTQTPGRFHLTLAVTGTPPPLTLTIQGTTAGAPSGSTLATTVLPPGFLTGAPTSTSIPLPCSLTNATQYWIVANAVGDVSNFYSLSKSNQVTGVSTSANGTTWTTQAYGIIFDRWDQSLVQPLVHTYEDSGARWTTLAWNANNQPSKLSEYTVAQAANDYVQSVRSFSYSGSSLTGVA